MSTTIKVYPNFTIGVGSPLKKKSSAKIGKNWAHAHKSGLGFDFQLLCSFTLTQSAVYSSNFTYVPQIYALFCQFLSQQTFTHFFKSSSKKFCNIHVQNKGGGSKAI